VNYGLVPFTPGRPIAEAKADLFKAMGHPARVRVLEVLAARDSTIGELAAETGLELSHLSQQVAVLRRAGLVDSRRVKNTVVCSLRDPRTSQLLVVARQLLSDNLRGAQQLLDALDNDEDAIATHAESDASSTRRSRARKSVGSDR
jgi:DNA-binding transcriptional ArsR family regulator